MDSKHSTTPVLNLANVSVPSRGKRESRQMKAKKKKKLFQNRLSIYD